MKRVLNQKKSWLIMAGFIVLFTLAVLILPPLGKTEQFEPTIEATADRPEFIAVDIELISRAEQREIEQKAYDISVMQVSMGDGAYIKTGSLKEVSIEKLTEKVITTPSAFNLTEYPLIAMLKEKDIYLFGADDGVILKQGDRLCTFDWSYLTPRFILPILHSGDYDGDRTEELMIVLYVGSGTGVSIQELHILEPESEQLYRDIRFEPSDYIEQLNSSIKYSYDQETKLTFMIDGTEYEYDTPEFFEEYTFESIGYGDIISFEYMDGIKLTADPGFSFVGVAPPVYFGSVKAEVIYQDATFRLADFKIKLDMMQ